MASAAEAPRRTPKLSCHERALRLLAVRPRSRHELETRLLRAGFEPAEVDDEIGRLEDVGLVDDRRFATEFAEHALTTRLEGRRNVSTALAARGVPREVIEETLGGAAGDESDRLSRLASARASRLASLPPETAHRRLASFLVRRGYDPGAARAAASRALAVEADVDEP